LNGGTVQTEKQAQVKCKRRSLARARRWCGAGWLTGWLEQEPHVGAGVTEGGPVQLLSVEYGLEARTSVNYR
jgi:hypothetical protein